MTILVSMDDRQLRQFLKELQILPQKRQKNLVRNIGTFGKNETRLKLARGGGVPPSKWIRARKGVNKSMTGAADKVQLFMLKDTEAVVETTDPRYSLSQHARGYTKPAGSGGFADRVFGPEVVIPLKNPSALSPPVSNPFRYDWTFHRTPSVVPPRDILPSDAEMATAGESLAKRWVNKIVSEALAKAGL